MGRARVGNGITIDEACAPPSLCLVGGEDWRECVPLPEVRAFSIGRKVQCSLVIGESYAYVSGEHCRLHNFRGVVEVEDLSANGTFLNGTRIGKGNRLRTGIGDEISLAKPTRRGGALKFKIEAAPTNIVAPTTPLGAAPTSAPTAVRVTTAVTTPASAAGVPVPPSVPDRTAIPLHAELTSFSEAVRGAAAPTTADPLAVQPTLPATDVVGIPVSVAVPAAQAADAMRAGGALSETINADRKRTDEALVQLRTRSEEEAPCGVVLSGEPRVEQVELDQRQEEEDASRILIDGSDAEADRPAAELDEQNERTNEDCEAPALAERPGPPLLCLIGGEDWCKCVALPETGGFSIGRKAQCSLVVEEDKHAYVSAEHCRIHICSGVVQVEDLSANGTFLNGIRIGKGKRQQSGIGDEISLAKPTRRGGALKFKIETTPTGMVAGAGPIAMPSPTTALAGTGIPASGSAAKPTPASGNIADVPMPPSVPDPKAVQLHAGTLRGNLVVTAAPTSPTANVVLARGAHSEELDRDGRRRDEDLAQVRVRSEEEVARSTVLSTELCEVQAELNQQQQQQQQQQQAKRRRLPQASEAGFPCNSVVELAEDCEELREGLFCLREEGRHHDQALPQAEEPAIRERHEIAMLRVELESERSLAEKAGAEVEELRATQGRATEQAVELRSEVVQAEARITTLEDQCVESTADIKLARTSAAQAQARLDDRTRMYTELRSSVQEHSRVVSERLGLLEHAVLTVPGPGDSIIAGSRPSQPFTPPDPTELQDRLFCLCEESRYRDQGRLQAEEAACFEQERQIAELRADLENERNCAEHAGAEVAELRAKEDRASEQAAELRSEVAEAAVRITTLEVQCTESAADIEHAKKSAAHAWARLDGRAKMIKDLRSTVREHSRIISERVGLLEYAVLEAPGAEDSIHPSAEALDVLAPTESMGQRVGPLAMEASTPPAPPHGNPEEPTIAYPPGADYGGAGAGHIRAGPPETDTTAVVGGGHGSAQEASASLSDEVEVVSLAKRRRQAGAKENNLQHRAVVRRGRDASR